MHAARISGALVALVSVTIVNAASAGPIGFIQTNLVSSVPGEAAVTDPDLKNPWGISFGSTTPFWLADNGTGLSTLYTGDGTKQGLVVTIPPAPGSPPATLGTPTGTVFNPNAPSGAFVGDRFLFATEDGDIAGWQGGTSAVVRVDSSASDAAYKGLALLGNRIYATDFHNGKVDVFDSAYGAVTVAGSFTDPNLPSGFAPFGIQNLGGELYVTYAKQVPGSDDDQAGPGNGFVDVFDANGVLQRRLISSGALDSPWGLALAPAGFGDFGGMLLVGNFGDGRINAYDPVTAALLGSLVDTFGGPIVIDGLWGLAFGNNGIGFDPNKLYFAAGINDEQDGLFGSLAAASATVAPVPEPGALVLVGTAGSWLIARRRVSRFFSRL